MIGEIHRRFGLRMGRFMSLSDGGGGGGGGGRFIEGLANVWADLFKI